MLPPSTVPTIPAARHLTHPRKVECITTAGASAEYTFHAPTREQLIANGAVSGLPSEAPARKATVVEHGFTLLPSGEKRKLSGSPCFVPPTNGRKSETPASGP